MDEPLNYLRRNIWKDRWSRDLFYEFTSKLNILVSHSGQMPAGAISTIVKILNLTPIVCHLSGSFSVFFFSKNKAINYCHVTHFIRFHWSYNIKVVKIGYPANSKMIIPNPGRVINVFLILFKLGLSHALTCLRSRLVQSLNSPFFPPHIGAEPGREKEESRTTCMRMLRTPPFFPPNRKKNHIWKYFPDLACGAIF